MTRFKFEDSPLNLDHLVDEIEEEEEENLSELILDDEITEEEEEEFLNDVSGPILDYEVIEEEEDEEAEEFLNDICESILDDEFIEEEEEEAEEFVNDVSEPILDVDVSENMETRTEWTIRLINEGHQGPNQTSGRSARTPRMRVITDYTLYRIQMPESTLDDTCSDEIEEEEEEEEEEEDDIKDQDISEYLETWTCYAPSPAMDIDVNEGDPVVVDEEQEACCICLAEYQDEDTIATLQCGYEFHVECINKWLQRKKACPFCRAPILPPSHN